MFDDLKIFISWIIFYVSAEIMQNTFQAENN